MRQGVNRGVGTVARTGVWAVEQSANGVSNVAMTGARAVIEVVMDDTARVEAGTGPGNASGTTENGSQGTTTLTVARTSALGLDQGAGVVGNVARTVARTGSAAIDQGAGVVGNVTRTLTRTGSAAMDQGADVVGSVARTVARTGSVAIDHGADVVGNVARTVARTGALAVEQSTAGVRTVARNGAWMAREGAEILLPFQAEEKNTIEGGELSYEYTEAGGGEGANTTASTVEGDGQEVGGEGVIVVEPGRRLTEDEGSSDRDILLLALETAEVRWGRLVLTVLSCAVLCCVVMIYSVFILLDCAVQCGVVLCFVASCCGVLSCAVTCHAVPCFALLCFAVLR